MSSLRSQMGQAWQECGQQWTEPEDADVQALSHEWQDVVGTLYDDYINVEGWKTDWVRAAKLYWLERIGEGLLWESDFTLTKSTLIPGPVYHEIALWIRGNPIAHDGTLRREPAVQAERQANQYILSAWLLRQKDRIWQRADALRLLHDRHYYTRIPMMSMDTDA
jgi:hypothetical protein